MIDKCYRNQAKNKHACSKPVKSPSKDAADAESSGESRGPVLILPLSKITTKNRENLLQLQSSFVSATLILQFSAYTVTSLVSLYSRSFVTVLSNTSLTTDFPGTPLVITLH